MAPFARAQNLWLSLHPSNRHHLVALWYTVSFVETVTLWRYVAGRLVLETPYYVDILEFFPPIGFLFALSAISFGVQALKKPVRSAFRFIPPLFLAAIGIGTGMAVNLRPDLSLPGYTDHVRPDGLSVLGTYLTSCLLYVGVSFCYFFKTLQTQVRIWLEGDHSGEVWKVRLLVEECEFWVERGVFAGAAIVGLFSAAESVIWLSSIFHPSEKIVPAVTVGLGLAFGLGAVAFFVGYPLSETIGDLRKRFLNMGTLQSFDS